MKAAFDALPLDQRAKLTMSSNAPYESKVQRVKDMYAKEGKTPPEDILKGGAQSGQH